MKNIRISLTLGALLGGIIASSPVLSADLLEVFRIAQQNDPEIATAEANFFAAREGLPQARAGYLPQLDIQAERGRTDQRNEGEEFFAGQIFLTDSERETDSTSWSVNLRQTIFNWGTLKEIGQSRANVSRAEAEYRAAQQELIVRVSERYFDLLAAQDSLEAAEINREAISRQLDQSKKRFEVGLIAVTDVQESQAAFDQAVAEVIGAERAANSARENLRAILGEYVEQAERPSNEMPLPRPDPESADDWVQRALEQNLNVVANRFAVESAETATDLNRAGHYPSLDLVARHSRNSNDFESSSYDFQDQMWEAGQGDNTGRSTFIGLQLNVPIFSGGATRSRVRESAHRASAARSTLVQAMRGAESQARDTYLGVVSDISRVDALRQAHRSAQTALRATQAGYDVGTRTAVDVLDARRNELQAQVNYQRARYDYILNTLRLKQAAGTLTGEDVAEVSRWME